MKKTIGFVVACSTVVFVGQSWAFGGGTGGAGPRGYSPNTTSDYYSQRPYSANPGSGSGFGAGQSANPGYTGEPRSPYQGPGYGGYQQAPGYSAPAQGYGYPSGPGGNYPAYPQAPGGNYGPYPSGPAGNYGTAPQAQDSYDIPRDSYGQQYHPGPGYGGYPQAPAAGYPGYGYPPPGYGPDPYYREGRDNNGGGFPNPMNMMKSPMNMFGGSKNRD